MFLSYSITNPPAEYNKEFYCRRKKYGVWMYLIELLK